MANYRHDFGKRVDGLKYLNAEGVLARMRKGDNPRLATFTGSGSLAAEWRDGMKAGHDVMRSLVASHKVCAPAAAEVGTLSTFTLAPLPPAADRAWLVETFILYAEHPERVHGTFNREWLYVEAPNAATAARRARTIAQGDTGVVEDAFTRAVKPTNEKRP